MQKNERVFCNGVIMENENDWFINELFELDKVSKGMPSEIVLSLHVNAIIENARRNGKDYLTLKKELLESGLKPKWIVS